MKAHIEYEVASQNGLPTIYGYGWDYILTAAGGWYLHMPADATVAVIEGFHPVGTIVRTGPHFRRIRGVHRWLFLDLETERLEAASPNGPEHGTVLWSPAQGTDEKQLRVAFTINVAHDRIAEASDRSFKYVIGYDNDGDEREIWFPADAKVTFENNLTDGLYMVKGIGYSGTSVLHKRTTVSGDVRWERWGGYHQDWVGSEYVTTANEKTIARDRFVRIGTNEE